MTDSDELGCKKTIPWNYFQNMILLNRRFIETIRKVGWNNQNLTVHKMGNIFWNIQKKRNNKVLIITKKYAVGYGMGYKVFNNG